MKLHQRGQAYHLRVRVPADLVEIIGRREIHQSLRTSDGRSARSRAATLRATIDAGFDRLRLARLGNQNQEHLSELANASLVVSAVPVAPAVTRPQPRSLSDFAN